MWKDRTNSRQQARQTTNLEKLRQVCTTMYQGPLKVIYSKYYTFKKEVLSSSAQHYHLDYKNELFFGRLLLSLHIK